MKNKLISATIAILIVLPLCAQNRRAEIYDEIEKSAGLYYPYPGPQSAQTPIPKGYKPFYISHFGRHGSRYHTKSGVYSRPVQVLGKADSAGVLTPLGKDVLARVTSLARDGRKRNGELTQLGFTQHREIATRMYNNFPEVFKGKRRVTATSTGVPRVDLSMFSFCSALHSFNPGLEISLDGGGRYGEYLKCISEENLTYSAKGGWLKVYDSVERRWIRPERLISSLFSDSAYVRECVDSRLLYEDLFGLASIAGNMDTDVRLHDIFTKEELYDLWQKNNLKYYMIKGPNPTAGDSVLFSSVGTLRHIIDCADEAIADRSVAATLRFSHDSFLAPLSTCMKLDGCRTPETDADKIADVWANFNVAPMAGNIQIIFLRNGKGDVIVKFLLNENEVGIPIDTDIYPYYHWNDVRKFYADSYGL